MFLFILRQRLNAFLRISKKNAVLLNWFHPADSHTYRGELAAEANTKSVSVSKSVLSRI